MALPLGREYLSKDLIVELKKQHDLVRTNPASFVLLLQQRLRNIKDGIYTLRPGVAIRTVEGETPIRELINQLSTAQALPPLKWSYPLHLAADEHAQLTARISSVQAADAMARRVQKYANWHGKLAENVHFGFSSVRDVLLDLLIDDGIPNRGHRRNILSSEFQYLGIGVSSHPEFDFVAVFTYAVEAGPLPQVAREVTERIQPLRHDQQLHQTAPRDSQCTCSIF